MQDACPLDGRRDPDQQLYLLALTQLVSCGLFARFLQLRRDHAIFWKLFLFLLFPLGLVTWLAVVLVVPDLHPLNRGKPADVLFMRETKYILRWSAGLSPTPLDEQHVGEIRNGRSKAPKDAEPLKQAAAHLVLPALSVLYCFAAVCMYFRRLYMGIGTTSWYDVRHWFDAVTFADQRTLEAAFGGIAVAILWIWQGAHRSSYHAPRFNPTYTELRSKQLRENFNGGLKSMVFLPADYTKVLLTYLPIIAIKQGQSFYEVLIKDKSILYFAGYLFIISSPTVLSRTQDLEAGMRRTAETRKILTLVATTLIIALVFYASIHGPLFSLVMGTFQLWWERNEISAWPVEMECPKLWQDPLIASVSTILP